MAITFKGSVADFTQLEGTGNCTLLNSPPRNRVTVNSVHSINDQFPYRIEHTTLAEYETGIGLYLGSHVFSRIRVIESSNSNNLVSFSPGTKTFAEVMPARFGGRELLSAGINYYCRADLGRVTLTNGSAIATTASVHGLSINDPIVFSYKRDKAKGTVTIASPGVWTRNSHGFVANDQVALSTTGALPTGYTAGTTYFVRNPTTNTFELASISGGTSINTSGTQSGIHFIERVATFPTGVTEGTVYYVLTAPTSTTFTFAASVGGGVITPSSVPTGYLSVATGNDSNNGLAQTRAGAMLTPQATADRVYGEIDFGGQTVSIVFADSTYLTGVQEGGSWIGGGTLAYGGNNTYPSNCYFNTPGAVFSLYHEGFTYFSGMKISTTAGSGLDLGFSLRAYIIANIEFGVCANFHMTVTIGAYLNMNSIDGLVISGNALSMLWATDGGRFDAAAVYYFTTALSYTAGTVGAINTGSKVAIGGATFNGAANCTGPRFVITNGGMVDTATGGNTSYIPGISSSGGTTTGNGFYA
jgi:hypothetical protein